MYTLLSGLYNYVTQKEEYYVLIIGLDNAGKTVSYISYFIPSCLELFFFFSNARRY